MQKSCWVDVCFYCSGVYFNRKGKVIVAERRDNTFYKDVCRFADTQRKTSETANAIQAVIDKRDLPVLFFFDSAEVPVCIERTGGHANIKKALRREKKEEVVYFYAEQSVGDTVYCGNDAIIFLDCMRMLPVTVKEDEIIQKWAEQTPK